MAHNKIQILMQKIQSIIGEDDSISRLEKDLIKDYLRELYDLTDAIPITGAAKEVREPMRTPLQPAITPVIPRAEIPQREEIMEMPKPTPPPVREVMEKAEPIINHDTYVPNGKRESRIPDPVVEVKEEPRPTPRINHPEAIPDVFKQETPIPLRYETLFLSSQSNELSDKLSRSPISDLSRAFSINDRLLVVADLFGNDQQKFQETIDILNAKFSFDEAKSYLLRYIVDRFNWLDEERSERARDFIKLVQRRYLEH